MMFENILLAVNDMMQEELILALPACFLWGGISVLLSPCHLASIPLVLGYIAGQENRVSARGAAGCAVLFSLGLFAAISAVGLLCSLAGRMLGDVPAWLFAAIGAGLILVGVSMLRSRTCSMPDARLRGLGVRGPFGALVLGAMYGMLSGVCTFGFLAPILAVATAQGRLSEGALMTAAFAAGHCLPIALAGGGFGLAESRGTGRIGAFFRRLSSWVIMGVGLYFLWQFARKAGL